MPRLKTYKNGEWVKPTVKTNKTKRDGYLFLNGQWVKITSTLYDYTTPVQIVANAYTTSANARPQHLSNGWIVTMEQGASSDAYLQVNKHDGNGFVPLCYISSGYIVDGFSITSIENMVYIIGANANTAYRFWHFDATTQTNVDIASSGTLLEINLQDINSVSITTNGVDSLYYAISTKTSTYPNSFNIRYCKGTINGDGSVNWGSVEQVTTKNAVGSDFMQPVIMLRNGIPSIVCNFSNYVIAFITKEYTDHYWTESTSANWGNIIIYNGGSYAQSSPSATVDSNGVIHVVWHGGDVNSNGYNSIHYASSSDAGKTWDVQLTIKQGSSSTMSNARPSIVINNNNEVFIHFMNRNGSTVWNILQMKYDGTTWSEKYLTNSSADIFDPSTCDNFKDFTEPLTIWQDNQNGRVAFYGKWEE